MQIELGAMSPKLSKQLAETKIPKDRLVILDKLADSRTWLYLHGILTDADLRRALVTRRGQDILSSPVREFMKADPKRVRLGDLASEALAVLNKYRIDELPVVDEAGRCVGLIDVQDLLGIKTLGEGETA